MGFIQSLPKFADLSAGSWVSYETDFSQEIVSLSPIDKESLDLSSPVDSWTLPFEPSVIANYSAATKILRSFRRGETKESQCYDRAHIWVHEAHQQEINFSKIWIFFADHYIVQYRFKWWFHVAPMALIEMRGVVQERVMDPKFFAHPLKVKLWTDLFMKNRAACKSIRWYREYSQHPNEDDCYLLRSTPFYWQPRHLEAYDFEGLKRSEFFPAEIDHSYREGFGRKL